MEAQEKRSRRHRSRGSKEHIHNWGNPLLFLIRLLPHCEHNQWTDQVFLHFTGWLSHQIFIPSQHSRTEDCSMGCAFAKLLLLNPARDCFILYMYSHFSIYSGHLKFSFVFSVMIYSIAIPRGEGWRWFTLSTLSLSIIRIFITFAGIWEAGRHGGMGDLKRSIQWRLISREERGKEIS